jgi:hypothetical protein
VHLDKSRQKAYIETNLHHQVENTQPFPEEGMRCKLIFCLAVIFSWISWNLGSAQTVIATYDIHDHASGLAYDGRNIWYGRYGTYG